MDTFSILGFVFGLMGIAAFCEQPGLKKRIKRLEDELSLMKGSSYCREKESFAKLAAEYTGRRVKISFKEDCADYDVIAYGNAKGRNVILDADESWILVEITASGKKMQKLFRIDSIDALTLVNE